MNKFVYTFLSFTMLSGMVVMAQVPDAGIILPGASIEKVADGFTFTEGVASDEDVEDASMNGFVKMLFANDRRNAIVHIVVG